MDSSNGKGSWFAVQVRLCREKAAATFLENEGYECLLPLRKSTRRWSDRMKVLELPMFPGYLFCRFDPGYRLPILKTPGVIQIVGIGKTPVPVDDDEVTALQCVAKSGLAAQPWSFLQVGQSARIECGPLRGLTGVIVKIKSEYKLVLSVTLLQRSVAVEVDGGWLADREAMETSSVKTATSTVAGPESLAARWLGSRTDQVKSRDRSGKRFSALKGGIDAPQESGAI